MRSGGGSPRCLVEPADVGEEVTGHLLAFGLDGVCGTDSGEQRGGLDRGEVQWCSTGNQVAQVPVETVRRPAAFSGQLVATVRQQAHHAGVVISGDAGEVGALDSDECDPAGVDVVGLAAVSGLQQPGSSGQRGWDVDDDLTGGDETLGEQLAEPVGSFDSPTSVGPLVRQVRSWSSIAPLARTRIVPISGTTDVSGGQDAVAQGRSGARPPRSNMIMVMNACGSWKPRALARIRPIEALLDSAIPFVKPHSMVASIDAR